MKVLVIDNYDSFTYNLVQLLEQTGLCDYQVFKNDEIIIERVNAFDKLLFSPGPGLPMDAGKMNEIIRTFSKTKSILGICLGHQAIGEFFGGKLENLSKPLHGIKENILITGPSDYLFEGIPQNIFGGLYHSWIIEEKSLPSCIKITARNKSGIIMGISHTVYDVKGLQFHPESVMTEYGAAIIKNWLLH
jgi:anthranilate synthase component II